MEVQERSLELLPMDVQHILLGKLDWTALATLACACKHFLGLVREINAQPIWNTELSQECPEHKDETYTKSGLGTPALDHLEGTIVGRLISKLRFSSRPDLCIVFADPDNWTEQGESSENLLLLHLALRALLPPCCSIVMGFGDETTGRSGASSPLELGDVEDAISISLLHLPPGVELSIAYQPDDSTAVSGKLPAPGSMGVHFLQVAGCTAAQQRSLKMLTTDYPDSTVIGGLVYSQLNSIFDFGSVAVYIAKQHGGAEAASQKTRNADQLAGRLMRGAVIIGLTGPNVEVHPIAIRGALPESEGFRVNAIVSPASPKHKGTKQPEVVAVTRVQRVVDKNGHLDFQPNLAEETQETPAEQLASLSYIASAGEHWPHSVAVYHRTLAGFCQGFEFARAFHNAPCGTVSIAAELEPGSVICSTKPQGTQNEKDWVAALSQVKRQLSLTLPPCQVCQDGGTRPLDARQPRPVLGALYIQGSSRGPSLHTPKGTPWNARRLNVETAIFDRTFPGAPIAGFGSFRELGSPPIRERFKNGTKVKELEQTTVAAIICLKPQSIPHIQNCGGLCLVGSCA